MKTLLFALSRSLQTGLLALAILCAAAGTSRAADFNYIVNTLGDTKPNQGGAGSGTTGDLRYCITQAGENPDGSTSAITFASGTTGTITLGGDEVVIIGNVAIVGPGASSLTVDANNASRAFFVRSGSTVDISGLTVTNGTGIGNDPTGNDQGAADNTGGAILNDGGVLTLTACTVTNNSCDEGGGIYNQAVNGDATLTLNNCTITNNTASNTGDGYAGGIRSFSDADIATLNISGGTISGNTAKKDGGGIETAGTTANTSIDNNCLISGNSASGAGGGLASESSAGLATITDSVVSGNAATGDGGGVLHSGVGTMTLLGCTLSGNTSQAAGGGLSNEENGGVLQLIVSESTVSGNTAATSGGGLYNYGKISLNNSKAILDLSSSTVSGNSATLSGGGLYNLAGGGPASLNLSNSTVANNSSTDTGGGIYNFAQADTASMVVANSTIAGNSAGSGISGLASNRTEGTGAAVTVTFGNTILALNGGLNFGTAYGTTVSSGFNLSDDHTCAAFFTAATNDLNATAAGLQTDGTGAPLLANNGGPTDTIALLAGSVAINGGKAANDPLTSLPVTADQRGYLRPFGSAAVTGGDGSDIGAFESGSSAPPAPVITSQTAATGQAGVAFSYIITASNNPTSFAASALPTGIVLNPVTGLISGTPSEASIVTINLLATNAAGSGAGTLTLDIEPAGPVPVITSAPSASGQVGVAFSFQIVGTQTPTSYAATSLPPGLTLDTTTGIIAGVPTEAGYFPNITLSATNFSGTGSSPFALTIQTAIPAITTDGTAKGVVGQTFKYQIDATNSPTSYGATGLPAGLSVNTTTGLITGTPTTPGTSAVTLTATNSAGTIAAALTITISAASVAPSIDSAGTASAQVAVPFTFQVTATNAPTGFTATGLPPGLSIDITTGLISGTPTQAGTFTVTLTASNGSGTTTGAVVITVAPAPPSPPAITSAATASGQVGLVFTYQITASNVPTSYGATGLPTGLSVDPSAGLISGTPTQAGTFSVSLTATNSTGTGTLTLTLTVILGPPVITSGTTAATQVGAMFTYQIAASNSPASYGATGLPTGLVVNTTTGLISGSPTVTGTFKVTLTATNAAGASTLTLTITITLGPPNIESVTQASAQVGALFTYQISSVGETATSYNATGLPAGLSVDPTSGLISGSATENGTFTVGLEATNSTGTGTATLTLTVGATPVTPPTIDSVFSSAGQLGVTFFYQISSIGNAATSYGADGLPNGLTIDIATGLISGAPTATGVFTVSIYATNAGGSDFESLTLTITQASPGVPVINSSPTAAAQAGAAFTYQISASGNAVTSYAATGLPAGLSVDVTAGVISGTPTQGGTFYVSLAATNSSGTGTFALTLTVTPLPNTTPVITSAATATATVGTPFSYQITATNSPTTFGAAGSMPGLSIDATTGIISGTPTQAGTFAIALTASNAGGTGTARLNLTVTGGTTVTALTVTLSATVPAVTVGSGDVGEFTLTLSAAQTSDVFVNITIKGSAVNGTDYVMLNTPKKIKAGRTTKIIKIIPQGDLGGAAQKVVTFILAPGSGYTVGTTGKVKVKINNP